MSDVPFPLSPLEKQARNHAILCTTGFLILLPLGALIARYARTFTNRWWIVHGVVQFLIAGPVILAGWSYGYMTTTQLEGYTGGHFVDPHKKNGLALLILYLIQVFLGAFIHYVKMPSVFHGRRPPQNYFHAFVGIVIFVLAAFQVHYGLYTEWPTSTGNLHMVPMPAKNAWLALIIVFWALYAIGLAFLPRQMSQERAGRTRSKEDEVALHENGRRN
ncbi:hypothetical protein HGRIS_011235 [Hohenbuehelia grisea]|uniref:Cytochrome b561 domain-containing protein n=1 Tax=Hohenbuehelia grisea TaxID=104357 RepID=A0ABR3JUK9_9AGAR